MIYYYRLRGEKTMHTTGEHSVHGATVYASERFRERERDPAAPETVKEDIRQWASREWPLLEPRERIGVLFAIQHGLCHYCGKRITLTRHRDLSSDRRASIDHRIPLVGGGTETFENTVMACQACNSRKGSMSYESFVAAARSDTISRPHDDLYLDRQIDRVPEQPADNATETGGS